MSDVQAMISAWQAGLPGSAWQSGSITPDTASLAGWMAGKLQTSGGLKITRSADPLYDRVAAYLELAGVDVGRALAEAGHSLEGDVHRARASADAIEGLAIAEKKARARLRFEQAGLRDGSTGFSAAQVRAAAGEVAQAEAALEEACGHDRSLARQARRVVA